MHFTETFSSQPSQHRLFLFFTICLLLSSFLAPTVAAPVVGPARPTPKHVDLPPISLDYFRNLLPHIPKDHCVFYYLAKIEANEWANSKDPKLSTIWSSYPYETMDESVNPLKAWLDAKRQIEYFKLSSEAYAKACSGESWVMMEPDEPNEPNKSIWTDVEYAAIKAGKTGITKVTRVDLKGQNPRVIWQVGSEIGALQSAGAKGEKPSGRGPP